MAEASAPSLRGDGSSCIAFLPVRLAGHAETPRLNGIIVEAFSKHQMKSRPSELSCLVWSCFGLTAKSEHAVNKKSTKKHVQGFRVVLLLGRAVELYGETMPDGELRKWLEADKATYHALVTAARFANEGKAFELRLQIDSQQAVAGCVLLESLLSADSGVRNGDLLVQSCLIQPNATAGACPQCRPAILIRTAPTSEAARIASFPLPFLFPSGKLSSSSSCKLAPEPAGGANARGAPAASVHMLAASNVLLQPGAAATELAVSGAGPAVTGAEAMLIPKRAVAPTSLGAAAQSGFGARAMEAGKEAAGGIAAWAGGVDGSAVIRPRLLAQDVGPYLVTLVQYPGDVVIYQNTKSQEFHGDLTGRPVGRVLLLDLLATYSDGGTLGWAAASRAPRRGPEAMAQVQRMLGAAVRGQSFSHVISVQPSLSNRLAELAGETSHSGGFLLDSGCLGAEGNANGLIWSEGRCEEAGDLLIDPVAPTGTKGITESITLSDALDRRLLEALVMLPDTAALKPVRRRPLKMMLGMGQAAPVSLEVQPTATTAAAGDSSAADLRWSVRAQQNMSVPLRMLPAMRGKAYACGPNSGLTEQALQHAGGSRQPTLVTESSASNIGIFVGGDADEEGSLVGTQWSQELPQQQQPIGLQHLAPSPSPLPSSDMRSLCASTVQGYDEMSTLQPATHLHAFIPQPHLTPPRRSTPSHKMPLPPALLNAFPSFTIQQEVAPPMMTAVAAIGGRGGIGNSISPPTVLPPAASSTLQRLRDAATTVAMLKKRQALRRVSSAFTFAPVSATQNSSSGKMNGPSPLPLLHCLAAPGKPVALQTATSEHVPVRPAAAYPISADMEMSLRSRGLCDELLGRVCLVLEPLPPAQQQQQNQLRPLPQAFPSSHHSHSCLNLVPEGDIATDSSVLMSNSRCRTVPVLPTLDSPSADGHGHEDIGTSARGDDMTFLGSRVTIDCRLLPLRGPRVSDANTNASGPNVIPSLRVARSRRPPRHTDVQSRLGQLLTNYSPKSEEHIQTLKQQQQNCYRHGNSRYSSHYQRSRSLLRSLPLPSPPVMMSSAAESWKQNPHHDYHALGTVGSTEADSFQSTSTSVSRGTVERGACAADPTAETAVNEACREARPVERELDAAGVTEPRVSMLQPATCGDDIAHELSLDLQRTPLSIDGGDVQGGANDGEDDSEGLDVTAANAFASWRIDEAEEAVAAVVAMNPSGGNGTSCLHCDNRDGGTSGALDASRRGSVGTYGLLDPDTFVSRTVPAALPSVAVTPPQAPLWHKVHITAIQGGELFVSGDLVSPQSVNIADSSGGGGQCGDCGFGSTQRAVPGVWTAEGTDRGCSHEHPSTQQQKQQRQKLYEERQKPCSFLLVVTQVDVTAEVEAQQQMAALLREEHKVLESIFPRHCIEYLTLRGHGSRDHLRGRSNSRIMGHRNLRSGPGRPGASAIRGMNQGREGSAAGIGNVKDEAQMGDEAAMAAAAEESADLQAAAAALDGGPVRLASLATWHSCVTLLFCDIVGFTTACSSTTPFTVMAFLNDLYSRFDSLVDIYKIYKVETIGDCYMVAGGLVAYDEDGYKSVISGTEDPLHAVRTMEFAKAMLRESRKVRMPHSGEPVQLRVGLHSGPVTSGVVGDAMPRFCLFGDTVNVASRMESTCTPGRIHVSAATQSLLPRESWRDLGLTAVKGKGEMRTFEWVGDVDGPLDGAQVTRLLGLYL